MVWATLVNLEHIQLASSPPIIIFPTARAVTSLHFKCQADQSAALLWHFKELSGYPKSPKVIIFCIILLPRMEFQKDEVTCAKNFYFCSAIKQSYSLVLSLIYSFTCLSIFVPLLHHCMYPAQRSSEFKCSEWAVMTFLIPACSLYFLKRFYLFIFILERGREGERERERNINVWLPLACPLLGTWPATQACALDWESNQSRPVLNHWATAARSALRIFDQVVTVDI